LLSGGAVVGFPDNKFNKKKKKFLMNQQNLKHAKTARKVSGNSSIV